MARKRGMCTNVEAPARAAAVLLARTAVDVQVQLRLDRPLLLTSSFNRPNLRCVLACIATRTALKLTEWTMITVFVWPRQLRGAAQADQLPEQDHRAHQGQVRRPVRHRVLLLAVRLRARRALPSGTSQAKSMNPEAAQTFLIADRSQCCCFGCAGPRRRRASVRTATTPAWWPRSARPFRTGGCAARSKSSAPPSPLAWVRDGDAVARVRRCRGRDADVSGSLASCPACAARQASTRRTCGSSFTPPSPSRWRATSRRPGEPGATESRPTASSFTALATKSAYVMIAQV